MGLFRKSASLPPPACCQSATQGTPSKLQPRLFADNSPARDLDRRIPRAGECPTGTIAAGRIPAYAAERPVPAPAYAPPPPPVPVYTWTGCYAGANAGTSTGRSQQTTLGNTLLTGSALGVPPRLSGVPAGSSIAGDLNLSGFIGGFQGGCNYQMGAWVVGFEGDGMVTNKEGQNFEVGLVPFLGNGRANWISQKIGRAHV